MCQVVNGKAICVGQACHENQRVLWDDSLNIWHRLGPPCPAQCAFPFFMDVVLLTQGTSQICVEKQNSRPSIAQCVDRRQKCSSNSVYYLTAKNTWVVFHLCTINRCVSKPSAVHVVAHSDCQREANVCRAKKRRGKMHGPSRLSWERERILA